MWCLLMIKHKLDKWIIKNIYPSNVIKKLINIPILNFKINEYNVSFNSKKKYRNNIKELYPNAILLEKSFDYKKVSLISILISLIICFFFFMYLNSKIILINIKGDYPLIEESLKNKLNEVGLKEYQSFPDINKILELENVIYEAFEKDIEFLEIRRNGSILNVKYTKRRNKIDKEELKGDIFASKDGIVKNTFVKNGQLMVDINQYVKKGDLLIDDTIIDHKNNEIVVGSKGNIYAYTWYMYKIEEENKFKLNEDEIFIDCMDKIRYEVSKNIDGEDEYIEKENVLQFICNSSTIKLIVHYTLVEDIAR